MGSDAKAGQRAWARRARQRLAVEPVGEARQAERGRCAELSAQALVEHEFGHGRWGVSPVGHGLARLVPQLRATKQKGHTKQKGQAYTL